MKQLFALFSIICLCLACSPRQLVKPYPVEKTQKRYGKSIIHTVKPNEKQISNSLLALSENTPNLIRKTINGEIYILAVSWKEKASYYKNDEKTGFYNTGNYPIWVTVAPILQEACQEPKFGRKEGLDLRLKQILGLPPTTKQQYFIEFWVKPADLFRPCPDPQIDDNTCGLCFPEETSETHRQWINDLRTASYYNCTWDSNYPWTQLGYTYDWNPRNRKHVGMSEFVIGKDKKIIVHKIIETADYCKTPE